MNRQLARRVAQLAAKLPPDARAGHTHAIARCFIMGRPAPPDGALAAYLATRPAPCHCDHPWGLWLFWDGASFREELLPPPAGWQPREGRT